MTWKTVRWAMPPSRGRPASTAPWATGATLNTAELSTGHHVITLTVTDSDGMSTQVQRAIDVVPEDAVVATNLQAAPFGVGVITNFGDPVAPYTVTLRSSSATEITWTATENIPWLSLNAASGQTPSDLVLTIDPSQQTVGTHTGTIRFSSGQAGNSPVDLPVTLQINGHALYLPTIAR